MSCFANKTIGLLTRYAKVVQSHAVKVWIFGFVLVPPFKRILDRLVWLLEILVKFIRRGDGSKRDVGKFIYFLESGEHSSI